MPQIGTRPNVIAVGVVGVCPPYDHADLTVNNAQRRV
jgi:hypothetical protein